MDLIQFTRHLVDMDSTSGREAAAAEAVASFLRTLPGLEVEAYEVEPGRLNVYAHAGAPRVVMSTHLDTVPPFFPSREDGDKVYGRGACDAKGIIAAQVFAARALLAEGRRDFGLLYVVGEERNSAGALAANLRPVGSRFLVNGEPTDSRMVRAGKGVLRVDLTARGRLAHSAYPELGESAIDKLITALERLRRLELPAQAELGPTTCNVGTIAGGRAPNVVADEARAEVMFRLVGPASDLKPRIMAAIGELVEVEFVLELPPIFPRVVEGFATCVVAFGTDIPKLGAWGEPVLYGPGSIHVAHTAHEFIAKQELMAAVDGYAAIVRALLSAG